MANQPSTSQNPDEEKKPPPLASKHHRFSVQRRVYDQHELNKAAGYSMPRQKLWWKCAQFCKKHVELRSCLVNSMPIIYWLPHYRVREYLLSDLIAGTTNAIMTIPQGMAYALLAELPPVIGMYMAFFPVLVYVILGTSPHVSMGTFAVVCLMMGKVVTDITQIPAPAPENSTIAAVLNASAPAAVVPLYKPAEIAGAMCFEVGCLQFSMWIVRLGMLSTLLSDPMVSAFTCASSIHVLSAQLKELLGIKVPKYSGSYKVIMTFIGVFTHAQTINWAVFMTSATTSVFLFVYSFNLKKKVAKYSRVPIPVDLIVIIIGTLVCRYSNLCRRHKITVVGHIPTGLPDPALPQLDLLPLVSMDAMIITMVSYSITMSMAIIFATENKTEIDPNQELLAMSGSKTGITSVVSATIILCVLLWIGPFFEAVPLAVLSAIIFVAITGMIMRITDIIRLLAGLLASIGSLFWRSLQPYICLLGRVLDTDIYLDIERYSAAQEIPGIKIFHFCGGLNFASKNIFRTTFYHKVGCMIQVVEHEESSADAEYEDKDAPPLGPEGSFMWDPMISKKVHCVIMDASALSYVDAPGVKALVSVQDELKILNIKVFLVGANAPVLEMIHTYNLIEKEKFHVQTFPTIHDALVYYEMTTEYKLPEIKIEPPVIAKEPEDI